jgi:hypothetical protein
MRTRQRSDIGPRHLAQINDMTLAQIGQYAGLADIGINLDNDTVRRMMTGMGFDAVDTGGMGLSTPATAMTPVRFLQQFLPGLVRVLTAARKIDTLVGVSTAGSWEDESIVQGIMEGTGYAQIYGDHTNIPLSSFNPTFEVRDIVRGEKGMQVGRLEEARASKMQINAATEKRTSAAIALEIFRNRIGFLGFNNGTNRTYGFLNDPGLLAYISLPAGASTFTTWRTKTFLEITADIRLMATQLRVQGKENIDPNKAPCTLAVATSAVDALTVTNVQGTQSVNGWIKENYPNWRIESATELDNANGGLSVVYLYAEKVDDSGTDDSRVFIQVVPTKLQALGIEKRAKGYLEDWTNATAGVMAKRPYAVVRASGV